MKLLFKQRLFSWFDSYDIYDEFGATVYTVEGQLAWGHLLKIYDTNHLHIGTVQQKVFTFLPTFHLEAYGEHLGSIYKEFSLLRPRFALKDMGWTVSGSFTEWDYTIQADDRTVATIRKEIWNFTDTYVIDVADPADALGALMVVLAIDAEKCSRD